jgi:hypothetical protein
VVAIAQAAASAELRASADGAAAQTIVDEYFAEHGEAGGRGGADDDVDEDDM